MKSIMRGCLVVGMVLVLATVAGAETHVGDWDVTGEITASGNFATFGDSSYVTPFSGWSGSSRMVAVRQPNAVSSGVSAGFMFSNNQTSGSSKNIAQLMFLNEAIVAAEKRVAQILVTTGGTTNSGKMYFRVFDAGSATNALIINRFGTVTVGDGLTFPDGETQETAYMGATGGGTGNTASGFRSTVGGGAFNTASATEATVGGGGSNTASGDFDSTVGGGADNVASADYATVGGGRNNYATGPTATIGGGEDNAASATGATLGGGYNNAVTDDYGTIAGGYNNQAGDDAGTTADKMSGTVGGGYLNTASGWGATIPGGANNTASGEFGFAAGYSADATHNWSFVWGDQFGGGSAAANTFNIHASGGIYYEGGSIHTPSDRNKKEHFEPVDTRAVLTKVAELPMSTWNYKTEDGGYRHMGPMGQDFRAAFGLGSNEKHITTVDADGVALAAIQGLYELVEEKDAQIAALRVEKDAEIGLLRQQNASLEARLEALEEAISKD
jgi:hypothetical protein